MRRIMTFLLAGLTFFCCAFTPAHAETILFFAPTRVEVSDQNPVQEIRVTNMSSSVRSYSISTENIVMNTNGTTVTVDNFDYSAKRMVRFVPHQFSIKPGERQIIRVMARFLPDTQDGDYHVHLNFFENLARGTPVNEAATEAEKQVQEEVNAKANAQIAYSTSIPVIVTKGEVKTDVGFKDHNLFFDQQNRAHVGMILTRSGNGQGTALVEATYTAPDGKEVMAGVRRTAYIYREIDQRDYKFMLELLEPGSVQKGGKITLKLYNKNTSQDTPVDSVVIPVQ